MTSEERFVYLVTEAMKGTKKPSVIAEKLLASGCLPPKAILGETVYALRGYKSEKAKSGLLLNTEQDIEFYKEHGVLKVEEKKASPEDIRKRLGISVFTDKIDALIVKGGNNYI